MHLLLPGGAEIQTHARREQHSRDHEQESEERGSAGEGGVSACYDQVFGGRHADAGDFGEGCRAAGGGEKVYGGCYGEGGEGEGRGVGVEAAEEESWDWSRWGGGFVRGRWKW